MERTEGVEQAVVGSGSLGGVAEGNRGAFLPSFSHHYVHTQLLNPLHTLVACWSHMIESSGFLDVCGWFSPCDSSPFALLFCCAFVVASFLL